MRITPLLLLLLAGLIGCGGTSSAPDGGAPVDAASAPDLMLTGPPVVLLPKEALGPDELGLLINLDDPQSVAVAAHYRKARRIPAGNVVELHLGANQPVTVTAAAFAPWKTQIDAALPPGVQALAVSWIQPSIVECMSLTSALAFGFDRKWCNRTGKACGPTADSPYYLSESTAPFTTDGIRPAMVLAGATAEEAIALIDRGVAADGTFPTGEAWLVTTTDKARSSRAGDFAVTADTWTHPEELSLRHIDNSGGQAKDFLSGEKDIIFYLTGLASVPEIASNTYRPGAIADHLTSYGGQIPNSGQMSILKWIQAGATASYGTVVEPCNYPSKFPNSTILLPFYYHGASLLEAYWKSVAWPGEGLFIGEPLARPWGTVTSYREGALEIRTTALVPGATYAVEEAPSSEGPWSAAQEDISVPWEQRKTIRIAPARSPYYRLVER